MINESEKIICNPEAASLPGSELVLFKENLIRDISLLTKNFDLSSMPSNYMRKRSKIEEIIYQAVFNQNNHKSPFASFKIANDCLPDLDKIDIVTCTNNLKKVMKSLYANSEQISIMVHKIGNTWLMDEFDLDALFLGHPHYADWNWLREFIEHDRLQLAKPDLSRASLTMRDLYAKFLYHSVNQLSIQLPDKNDEQFSQIDKVSQLPISNPTPDSNLRSTFPSSGHRYDHHREDFINLVDWKLNDLSFVVGSDLSIFGTKTHPCISLRLHPSQEPINILTGIDMWLENLLNEVPEVAMCYHDQGIVMREYEIFRTEDIPQITGFNKDEVESIAKNMSHFLSTNATKEGHTYWLFKETDSTMVKLYDLTDIWMKNQQNENVNENTNNGSRHAADGNPFILPVAVLCYKMAENRINQWHRARNKRGKYNLTSSQFNKELLENKLADDNYYFNDIFRLLKNCINLLIRTDKHQDLVNKAIILMCQLYLEVDQTTLSNLHHHQEAQTTDTVKFDLSDLKNIDKMETVPGLTTTLADQLSHDDSDLIGTQLFQLCAKNRTEELFVKTMSMLEGGELGGVVTNGISFTEEELLLRNTLLSGSNVDGKELSPMANKKTIIKEDLIESALNYHEQCCMVPDLVNKSAEQVKGVLKAGFLVALLDGHLWKTHVPLIRNSALYGNLINSFYRWHVNLNCNESKNSGDDGGGGDDVNLLDKMDTRLIHFYCAKNDIKIVTVTSLFRSIFMLESKRESLSVGDPVHRSWYDAIVYLLQVIDQLVHLPMNTTDRASLLRGIPLLIHFLVGATVNVYQQESIKYNDAENKTALLRQWCKDTIFVHIALITQWTNLPDFNSTIDDMFLALVWTNKAKLYRLSLAILDEPNYIYNTIESYTRAIETSGYLHRKNLSTLYISLMCDRLDMCMQLLERTYNSVIKVTEDEQLIASTLALNKALELSDRIYKAELCYQGYEMIKTRLRGLRQRMNYVRYYLNLKTNMTLDYEQIVNDFQSDMRLILIDQDSISKCKESLLIMFYLIKVESDRLEILSVPYLEHFLKENTKILDSILSVDSYKTYLATEIDTKLKEIFSILRNIVRKLLAKYQQDCHKKKKVQRNKKSIQQLERFLKKEEKRGDKSSVEEMRDLLREIMDFV